MSAGRNSSVWWVAWCAAGVLLGQQVAAAERAVRAPEARATRAVSETWGIEPVAVRTSGGGRMVDFRYRVVDAQKARQLFDRKLKPVLRDHRSRAQLAMPEDTKLGGLRSSPRAQPENGKVYYVLFANPNKTIARGAKVDVVMGDCVLANLVVQ
ncbi:MAG: hypothetical protein HY904_14180 [Deltaproteobacteria bacterium]|nr:hypothetical protein [Deltaproteobacteria bacterium]